MKKICHIGFFGHRDLIYRKEKVNGVLDKYTKVIDTGKVPLFVRDKNKLFFETLLGEKIDEPEPLAKLKTFEIDINSDYIIISPFSRSKNRTYSPENYAKIIDHITQNLKLPIAILGNKAEEKRANDLVDMCCNKDMIYNMAGKLSITDAILYIRRAKLLIANETGTVHIAQNFGIKTICISNGSYINSFQPYPKQESVITYIYPDNFIEYQKENDEVGDLSDMDINLIYYKQVISAIDDTVTAVC